MKRLSIIFATVLAVDLVVTAAWWSIARVPEPMGATGDAMAVLWGDELTMGEETERRLALTERLWNQRAAPVIAVIGGSRPAQGRDGAQTMRRHLVECGIPDDAILSGRGSNDTVSNIAELAELARQHGLSRILVIGGPLQGFRIKLLDQNPQVELVPITPPCPECGPIWIWQDVHYELAALLSFVLPHQARSTLLSLFRA